MPNYSTEIKLFIESVAIDAGRRIRIIRNAGSFETEHKGPRNLVTTADKEAEEIILKRIRSAYPDHGILSEESESDITAIDWDRPLWVIDPIDGTTNYAYGHFQTAVSIAFYKDARVQAGVVYAPFVDELFSAALGSGAFKNSKPIHTRNTPGLIDTLVATGFPYKRDNVEPLVERLRRVLTNCQDIRRIGACSVDMCWLACGRLDAYYETVNAWDMAAAGLIVREAGGVVGHFGPAHRKLPLELLGDNLLAASSQKIFDAMLELLSD